LVSNALSEPLGTQSAASSRFVCEVCNIVFANAQVCHSEPVALTAIPILC